MDTELLPENIRTLERPDRALWRYYVLQSLFSGPLIFFTFPYLYFRFHTLRYRFDDEGIHMKVGWLFRREINLTYARIQDIHLRSGVIQRWFGLANVEIQTASGSSGAELVVEGFKEYEAIRDFLYRRMRGFKPPGDRIAPTSASTSPAKPEADAGAVFQHPKGPELISLLRGIHEELRKTREIIQSRNGGSKTPRADV